MEELKSMLGHVATNIELVAELLYQQNSTGFIKLGDLLTELTELSSLILTCKEEAVKSFDTERYLVTLTEAMKAMESKEHVLLADILQYDLLEQLKEFMDALH